MEPKRSKKLLYTEVVRPPAWLLLFFLFLTESIALSIWAAFDDQVGIVSAVIAILIVFVIALRIPLTIAVTEEEIWIGSAHIERKYLGEVTELDIEQMRLTRGRDADPAAFLALRFWQPRGVKIMVNDHRDATPYWLVTSKKSNTLTRVLKRN